MSRFLEPVLEDQKAMGVIATETDVLISRATGTTPGNRSALNEQRPDTHTANSNPSETEKIQLIDADNNSLLHVPIEYSAEPRRAADPLPPVSPVQQRGTEQSPPRRPRCRRDRCQSHIKTTSRDSGAVCILTVYQPPLAPPPPEPPPPNPNPPPLPKHLA
jgi:hypothetical protein